MKLKSFLLLAAGHFLADFYLNFMPALLPPLAERLHLTLGMAGLAMTGSLAAANFSQPVAGYLLGSRPRPGWLPLAVGASGVFMCGAAFSPSYAWLLVLPLLGGLANGVYHPVGSVLSYRLDARSAGLLISLFSTAGAAGYAVGPAAAAAMLSRGGPPQLAMLAVPGVLVAGAMLAASWPPHPPDPPPSGEGLGEGGLRGAVLLLTVVMALRAWGHLALSNYLVFFLQAQGWGYREAAGLLTWFLLAGAAGGLAGGRISDRVGRVPVIRFALAAAALCGALFLGTSGAARLAWLMACGAAVHASLPVMVVFAQELMPRHVGLAAGLSMGFCWGLGSLGVFFNGLLADAAGLTASFWMAVAVLAAGFLLALALPSPPRTRLGDG
ncbi:MAG: MFS transporter [Syntrophomonadaceae bacterium]|nr:MFS transporter [Syntrophomonadaceae bacterium]